MCVRRLIWCRRAGTSTGAEVQRNRVSMEGQQQLKWKTHSGGVLKLMWCCITTGLDFSNGLSDDVQHMRHFV